MPKPTHEPWCLTALEPIGGIVQYRTMKIQQCTDVIESGQQNNQQTKLKHPLPTSTSILHHQI